MLFTNQPPLAECEFNLRNIWKHYLTSVYKEVFAQMNINVQLEELSSIQGWLHALMLAYNTLLYYSEVNVNIITTSVGAGAAFKC